jgi:SAM-dependent methyltransferase
MLSLQSRFPGIWDAFQYIAGGVVDKRRLCYRHYKGSGRVLEVGCSVGNISEVFLKSSGITYVGLDIDPVAIMHARMKFKDCSSFSFVCDDLRNYATQSGSFGYILFAGCCHHMDDVLCSSLIRTAAQILEPGGIIVVVDLLLPQVTDPLGVRWYINLEQGKHLRSSEGTRDLLEGIDGLEVVSAEEEIIGATPFRMPCCARFGTYVLIKRV